MWRHTGTLALALALVAIVGALGVAAGPAGATSGSFTSTLACSATTNEGVCISQVTAGYSATTITLGVTVGRATDPTTDPNWDGNGDTFMGWRMFLDGSSDFAFDVFLLDLDNASGPPSFVGVVLPSNSTGQTSCLGPADDVVASFDTTVNTYSVSFPASCLGSPSSLSTNAEWVYDDAATDAELIADEPTNAAPCCAVTPDAATGTTTTTTSSTAPTSTTTTATGTTPTSTTTTQPTPTTTTTTTPGSVSFSSAVTGMSGLTAPFSVLGPWTLSWSYGSCAAAGSGSGSGGGSFIVDVLGAAGHATTDVGPIESNPSGNGIDRYTDSGTFSLSVDSECAWTIAVQGTPPGSTTTPTTDGPGTTSTTAPPIQTTALTSSGGSSGGTGSLAFTGPGGATLWLVFGGGLLVAVGAVGRRRHLRGAGTVGSPPTR